MNTFSRPSRRKLLKLTGAAALAASAPLVPGAAFAGSGTAGKPRHGLSVFGDLKYGPDFTHFDYVNPDAPKGGRFIFQAPYWYYNQNSLTYNTFNAFIL